MRKIVVCLLAAAVLLLAPEITLAAGKAGHGGGELLKAPAGHGGGERL